ncbi:MAG: tRNA (adenosine(37)-N6)-threonylcarbamoyltransferase complex ATPase subunit type 1 TsaE, partial [Bacteroidota bacterium]
MDTNTLTLLSTLDQLPGIARQLLQHAGSQKIWLFEGEMGAGKTTLIKALCVELGVQDTVNSPTFSIVHEYATARGMPVYHFDFYRLQHEEEALALDCMAYFESGYYCFIEWPTKIP